MQASPYFRRLDKKFWANVRTIGQQIGYSKKGQVLTHDQNDLLEAMKKGGLGTAHLSVDGRPTKLARTLVEYFEYRAKTLNGYVETKLMDVEQAEEVFNRLLAGLKPQVPLPMNKQKGDKKRPAYLTGIVNMLIEANVEQLPCDYDPRTLTTVTRHDEPLRTLSRRVDGCFPACVNPVAIWEIKEYYHTTTFGSRIADGVYETLLDGLELDELARHESVNIQHLLIVDSHRTWWTMGIPYLCRLIDMLNMGYVDEILFGYEVTERLPELVKGWVETYRERFA